MSFILLLVPFYLLLKGDYELCKTLLAEGMDPNLTDYAGWTPMVILKMFYFYKRFKIMFFSA